MIDLEDPFSDDSPTVVSNAVPVGKQGAAVIRHGEAEARSLQSPVRIADLEIQSFKKTQKAFIKFNEMGVTFMQGKNRQGKTSNCKALQVAIGGKSYVPDQPVRKGDPVATIKTNFITFDGLMYKLEREVKQDRNCTVKLTRPDGTEVERVQEFMAALAGKNWDNPLAIMNAKDVELMRYVKEWLGLDLTDLDAQEALLYEERTIIGRERDRLAGHAAKLKLQFSEGVPEEEQTATELKAQWDAAIAENIEKAAKREKLVKANERLAEMEAAPNSIKRIATAECERLNAENESIKAQIEALNKRFAANTDSIQSVTAKCTEDCKEADAKIPVFKKRIEDQEKEWGELADVDTTAIAEAMDDIEEVNRKVRLNNAWREASAACDAEDAIYDAKTRDIDAVRAERKRIIAAAMAEGQKIIPELHFDESGQNLYFGDFLFSEAAESDRLKVSIILSFAMNAGSLKIAVVDNGEGMDQESKDMLDKIAKAIGVQILFASVSDATESDTAYIISEGIAIPPKQKGTK